MKALAFAKPLVGGGLIGLLLVGCASTTVSVQPGPQPPVCDRSVSALVLWAPHWRPDQKDVAAREEAAASGIQDFLANSGCFRRSELRRVAEITPSAVLMQVAAAPENFARVVTIEVRELGPVVKVFSSAGLIEGGTEVVLHIAVDSSQEAAAGRPFVLHWQNGGPGIIKGVASLPHDMQEALRSGFQPAPR